MEQEIAGGRLSRPVTDRDHMKGPEQAQVTLVLYGDYQCPYTRKAFFIVDEVLRRTRDWTRFVFRHAPRDESLHEFARMAAKAAEAAAAQGKFWEMHEYLFECVEADEMDRESLELYAEEVGLDMEQFRRDLDDRAVARRVDEDVADSRDSGVDGTPTFFINGIKYKGPTEVEAMMAALKSAA